MPLPLRTALPAALALIALPALAGPMEGQAAWAAGDYVTAIREWRSAALSGDPAAQYGLGQAYLYGRGLATDLEQAELWFRKAAAQGHLEAADNLGLLLFQQDKRREALPYLERSAARGEPRAQYVLGTAKFNGDLVDRDWVGAYALMTRASAAGLPQASRALAQMDQEIPLAERQQGQVLARNLEVSGMQVAAGPIPTVRPGSPALPPVMATPTTPPPAMPSARPRAVTAVPLPPSSSVGEAVAADTSAGAPYANPTPVKPAAVASKPAAAAPKPALVRSGDWLVQVGAFSNRASAQARFDAVRRAVPSLADLQPFLQEAGRVTRTRAGPFALRGAAEAACRTIRATGQACFPVRR